MAVLLYGVLKSRSFHVPWFESLKIDSSALNTIATLSVSIVYAILVYLNWKEVWYVVAVFASFSFDLLLKQSGLIHSHTPWDSLYYLTADVLTLIIVAYLGKAIKNSDFS